MKDTAQWQAVMVTILTEAEDSPMRLVLPGEMCRQPDAVLLRWRERITEDAAEETLVRLRIGRDRVMMHRGGAFSTALVFEPGRCHSGSYQTPYGELPLTVETLSLAHSAEADGGECRLEYDLTIQGSETARRKMRIRYAGGAA